MHLKGGTNPPNRKIVVSTAISPIETRESGIWRLTPCWLLQGLAAAVSP